MSTPDNPAGRLLSVLHSVKSAKINAEEPAWQVWAQIFSLEPNSTAVMERIVELNLALDQAEKKMSDLGRDTADYKKHIASIRRAISPNLFNAKWKTVLDQLTDGGLMALSGYSDIISITGSEGEVATEQLQELQRAVEDLIERTIQVGVTDEFSQFVLEQLEKVRQAIVRYRFRGPGALKAAMESVTGAMIGSRELVVEAKKTRPELYKELGSVMDLFNKTIQTVEKFSPYAASLAEWGFLKMLGPGS